MRRGLTAAISLESAEAWGEFAKTLAAIGGILGGTWAVAARVFRRWRTRRRQRGLEAKALRYLLDAQRHVLYFIIPTRESHTTGNIEEEIRRQKLLIDEVRDELWVADGHESARETERIATEITRVLTRTQAIEARTQRIKEPET